MRIPLQGAHVFTPEQQVVYPAQGVGQIERIETQVVGGLEAKFYIIRIITNNITVMVPVNNARNLGLRDLCSKEDAESVLVFFDESSKSAVYSGQNWNRRYREYSERLKSTSLLDVAYVVKELLLISAEKELSFGERRLLEQAMALITSELAIVLELEPLTLQKQIEDLFIQLIASPEDSEISKISE